MKRAICLATGVCCLLFLSCSRPQPVVEIDTHHWPDGTALSFIRDGKVVARSSLFGERARATVPKAGTYRLRVASPEWLTAVSPEIQIGEGITAYRLPIPVMRRRVGTTNLGVGFAAQGGEEACMRLLNSSPVSFTSIRIDRGGVKDIGNIIRSAHEKTVETILAEPVVQRGKSSFTRKAAFDLIDAAEGVGAEGVMIPSGEKTAAMLADIRETAARAHERGLTLSIGVEAGDIATNDPMAFFRNVPAPECPDDIVVVCSGTVEEGKDVSVVSPVEIENAVMQMKDARIPPSRVTVEISLSAVAYEGAGTNGGKRAPVEPGVLERLVGGEAKGGVLRLPDGSLRLVRGGVTYAWDDLEGIARKLAFLRTGEFARIHGVRIVWDDLGVSPDPAGLKALAATFGK